MRKSTWTPTEAVLILFKQSVDIAWIFIFCKKIFLFDDTEVEKIY